MLSATSHRIRIFDKISEHVKVAKSVDIAVPELAVTLFCMPTKRFNARGCILINYVVTDRYFRFHDGFEKRHC